MLDLSQYTNPLTYPQRENFKTTYYYKGGQVIATVRPGDKTVPPIPQGAVKETVVDEDAFRVARSEYGKREAALAERFKVDLLHDNGVGDNEFTRALYAIAYEQGHSHGMHEVETIFGDLTHLVDLAKKVYGE